MALLDRNTLKSFFVHGMLPTQDHFHDFIESSVNKLDDGISKNSEEGLKLSLVGDSNRLLSFFKNIEERSPIWSIDVNKESGNLQFKNKEGSDLLTFSALNKIGVKVENPEHDLDVGGVIGMHSREGTKYKGSVEATGEWSPIIENLNGCHAFEIVAGVGKKKTGKYALILAHAISTFGKSKSKIKVTQGYYGTRGNKIELRFRGTTYNYALEMRTKGNYEGNTIVNYHISTLWNDTFMDNSFID